MLFLFPIYMAVNSLGIISAVIYLVQLKKSSNKLPEAWRKSSTQKKFNFSIYLLMLFLLLILINQVVLYYLASHHIDNGLAFSICFTFGPIPLFAFMFMHTHSRWKRYSYIALHATLIGFLIFKGYANPFGAPNISISLILNSVFFLIALLHLTDLLMHSKTDHFKLKLKISLVVLIFALLASILSTVHWFDISSGNPVNFASFLIQNINMLLFYFSFVFVFVSESIALRRRG